MIVVLRLRIRLIQTLKGFWEKSIGITDEPQGESNNSTFLHNIQFKDGRYEISCLGSKYSLNFLIISPVPELLKIPAWFYPSLLDEYNQIIHDQLQRGIIKRS